MSGGSSVLMSGGYSAARAVNAEETEMLRRLRPQVELNRQKYATFEAASVQTQVVSGTNYMFKVNVAFARPTASAVQQTLDVVIHKPLPVAGKDAVVTNVTVASDGKHAPVMRAEVPKPQTVQGLPTQSATITAGEARVAASPDALRAANARDAARAAFETAERAVSVSTLTKEAIANAPVSLCLTEYAQKLRVYKEAVTASGTPLSPADSATLDAKVAALSSGPSDASPQAVMLRLEQMLTSKAAGTDLPDVSRDSSFPRMPVRVVNVHKSDVAEDKLIGTAKKVCDGTAALSSLRMQGPASVIGDSAVQCGVLAVAELLRFAREFATSGNEPFAMCEPKKMSTLRRILLKPNPNPPSTNECVGLLDTMTEFVVSRRPTGGAAIVIRSKAYMVAIVIN